MRWSAKLHSSCYGECWWCSWRSDQCRCLKVSQSYWCCTGVAQSPASWCCTCCSHWREDWWTRWAQAQGRSPLSNRWVCFLPAECQLHGLELQKKRKRKTEFMFTYLYGFLFFSIYKASTVKKLKRRNIVKCYQCSIFLHRMMYFNWTFYEQDIFVIKSSVSSKD